MRVRCTAMSASVRMVRRWPWPAGTGPTTGGNTSKGLRRVTVPAVEERFLVTGGARLVGEVSVAGAKNSVLKLMAAALLAEGTTVISNCPAILDVPLMADVLIGLGCRVELSGDEVTITTPADLSHEADFPAVGRLRASVCVLGPLMGRCHRARVALPGGGAT